MHRTITVLAICLLILLVVPRVRNEEIKTENDEFAKNKESIEKIENITVVITEIKPMASELVAINVTEINNNDLPSNSSNSTVENLNKTEAITNNTVAEDSANSESKAAVQKTTIVHLVSTPEPDLNKDISEKHNETSVNKQHLIDGLKKSIKEAEEDLALKVKRLGEIKNRANAAQNLSEQAQNHLTSLIYALNSVQGTIIQSSKAAFETDWQLQLQTAMYNEAKRKFSRLSRELEMTKADYEKTKVATQNAMDAAKIAKGNAMFKDDLEKPMKFPSNEKSGSFILGNFGTNL